MRKFVMCGTMRSIKFQIENMKEKNPDQHHISERDTIITFFLQEDLKHTYAKHPKYTHTHH